MLENYFVTNPFKKKSINDIIKKKITQNNLLYFEKEICYNQNCDDFIYYLYDNKPSSFLSLERIVELNKKLKSLEHSFEKSKNLNGFIMNDLEYNKKRFFNGYLAIKDNDFLGGFFCILTPSKKVAEFLKKPKIEEDFGYGQNLDVSILKEIDNDLF